MNASNLFSPEEKQWIVVHAEGGSDVEDMVKILNVTGEREAALRRGVEFVRAAQRSRERNPS